MVNVGFDMLSNHNDDSICRLCLGSGARNSIFTTLGARSSTMCYSQMIEYFVSFTIPKDDGLPRLICSECISKLETSYSFKKQCEKSYTFLINNYNNGNSVDIKHEKLDSSNEEINEAKNIVNVEIKEIKYLKHDSNECSVIKLESNLKQSKTKEEHKCVESYENFDQPLSDEKLKHEYDSISTLQHSELLNAGCKSEPNIFAEVSLCKNNDFENDSLSHSKKQNKKKFKKKHITKTVRQKLVKSNKTNEILGIDINKLRIAEKLYQCNQCPRKYRCKRSFARHLENHFGIKSFFCKICEKYFSRKWEHMQTHDSPKVKKFQCKYCHKMFVTKTVLNVHIMIHSNNKPAKCDDCGKSFLNTDRLAIHKKTHSEKGFICQFCSRGFTIEKYLITHIKYKHTNERQYQCTLCEKQFVTSQSLKIHEHRHLGIKNFHCDLCKKSFVSKTGLITHSKMHTKDKPYECRVCLVKFKRSDHRNRHESTAHGVNLKKSKLMN